MYFIWSAFLLGSLVIIIIIIIGMVTCILFSQMFLFDEDPLDPRVSSKVNPVTHQLDSTLRHSFSPVI